MSATPDLYIPGKFERERRIFHHTLSGINGTATATSIDMFMDNLNVGAPPAVFVPNPGFTHSVVATHVFVDFIHGGVPPAGNWTLRLRKNEALVDSATFAVTATGAAAVHQKSCGIWLPSVRFDRCQTYHIQLDGPTVNVALARAILRFEELGGG